MSRGDGEIVNGRSLRREKGLGRSVGACKDTDWPTVTSLRNPVERIVVMSACHLAKANDEVA